MIHKGVRDESNIKHLNLLILYWIDEPLEHLTLKTNRKYAQENYRTAGNRKPTLKGFTSRLIQPPNQCKNTSVKSTWTIDEGSHLLIFKCLPKKQEPAGSLPRKGSLVRAIYVLSGYLVNTDTNRNHFGILHLTYYASRGTLLRALPSSTLWLQLLGPTAGLGQPVLHDICSPMAIRGQDGQAGLSF